MSRRTLFASMAILTAASFGCSGTVSDSGDSPKPGDHANPGKGRTSGTPGNGNGGATASAGNSGGSASGTSSGGGMNSGTMSGGGAADPKAAGSVPLQRLTRREYNNTVRDLLGDKSGAANDFPPDEQSDRLFPTAPLVDSLRASRLGEAASALAASVDLSKVLPCMPPAVAEAACLDQFIDKFGTRAYRRPVRASERQLLVGLYQSGRANEGLDFPGGIRLVIEAMLQSTGFLYHWEVGSEPPVREGNVVQLGPYQVASRLSYFLWGSMPDDVLFAAAAASQLSTEAQIAEQAHRMLADPRARDTVTTFFDQWLGIEQLPSRAKDAMVYPEFGDSLKAAMLAELRALSTGIALDADGRLETLLTSTAAQVTEPLAAIYGMKGVAGAMPQMVQLNVDQRAGLLTRAGFQALFGDAQGSNPIKRGSEIYKRLLCGVVPDPPANVPPPKPPSAGGTTRARFVEHGKNACAVACHGLFDVIGYAFENYDGVGRFRTMDNGLPVDASGAFQLDGKMQAFKDGRELSRLIAGSDQLKSCFASQVAGFALGRSVTDEDRASLDRALAAYNRSKGTIRDLLVGFASSRTFRYRTPSVGEVMQ